MGGWVGGWVEEEQAVGMSCCKLGVGWVGGWVGRTGRQGLGRLSGERPGSAGNIVVSVSQGGGGLHAFNFVHLVEEVGGWVGGWVGWVEESEAV